MPWIFLSYFDVMLYEDLLMFFFNIPQCKVQVSSTVQLEHSECNNMVQ